jgi:MGT family glycosyltransferase
MSIGNKFDRAELGAVPENFIVRSTVPQIEVLKHTRVFLTHGGGSSTNESLYFGVPMLVYPTSTEQYIQARRVNEVGAGRILWPRQANAENIRSLVTGLLADESVLTVARRMQTSFRAAGGPGRAVDEILRYTRERMAAAAC